MQPPTSQASSGARFGVVLAAAVLLAGLVAIIVTSSGSPSDGGGAEAPAPRRCLTAWNSDSEALAFGRHDSISHGYTDVQVGYMPEEGATSLSSEPEGGDCAVVFAANQLDPEAEYVGQIYVTGQWVPLSGLLEPLDLAELQDAAIGGANATVTSAGKLIEQSP
jgi:hypothetical protein